jgi:hypothetical protein
MSYRVKRIDPYWIKNPILPLTAVVGVIAAWALISRDKVVPSIIAAVVGGAAVVLSAQPALSAVFGTLGLVGGLITFVFFPNPSNASMPLSMRLLSTLMFTLFYAVLMDGVILLVAVLYNLFAGAVGLGGVSFDLEDEAGAGEA